MRAQFARNEEWALYSAIPPQSIITIIAREITVQMKGNDAIEN